jgi:hypothetical protein
MAVLAQFIAEASDVLVGLGPQRGGDHPTRALTSELVERDRDLVVLPSRERANIHHGVPSFLAPRGGSVLINREGTPPSFSGASTTFGYSSTEVREVASSRVVMTASTPALPL